MNKILALRLLDAADDAAVIIDAGSRIRYANDAMYALSGYAAGSLPGQQIEALLPDAVREQHGARIGAYLAGYKKSKVLGHKRHFAIRHHDGSMLPIVLKAMDLGKLDDENYMGAFFIDQRHERAIEQQNTARWQQLQRIALSDPLTHLPNRRAFEIDAVRAAARDRRAGNPMTIGIADIDFFKKVNDRHGHAAGDAVLQAIAAVLQSQARASDVIACVGGEEFGMLFPHTDMSTAHRVAERIRLAVAATCVTFERTSITATISIGLAPLPNNGDWKAGFMQADAALYQAKNKGRNRIEQA
ncbi:sensor domain-containing diguanylate cyclase [Janthinobacterium sp. HSC-3S05]|uniref:GGDEF domain-containing protein n=1 Tax=Janthinobacterium lividum TaxID=29581 RepID=UPI001CD8993C|nr:sensor domain-containing diguanylate cyclase [Janthinobacterium lividum]MCA1859229.1 sensor domain-containing diguanylate cyclase [Janthinobacterium lividum]